MVLKMKRCAVAALCGVFLVGCGEDPVEPSGDDFEPVESRGSWASAAPLPVPIATAGAAAMGGKIFVVGGADGDSDAASARVLRYDPALDAWEQLTDLPEGLRNPGVTAKGDTLLVAGGNLTTHGLAPRRNVWRWDEADSEWIHHGLLPIASANPQLAGTASGVFAAALGGAQLPPGDSTAFQASTEGEWRYAAPAPLPVQMAVSEGNSVWAIGLSGQADFDAASGVWSSVSTLPTSGFLVGAWRADGRRHLLTRSGTSFSHRVLLPGEVLWGTAKSPDAPAMRSQALSVSVGGLLYLIGGLESGVETSRVDVFTWS